LHAKIKADRDRDLLRIALHESKPEQRREILEGLAELRPLNAQAPRDFEHDDQPTLPPRVLRKRRRRAGDERIGGGPAP
jgi:hypothetical protein